jgi:hypothetical protein
MSVIEFRLLGPLEVWRDGRRLTVGGAKPRALLAALLLRAGRVVSTDELIEALSGEHPPAGAANALQAHVSALRRALTPGRGRRDAEQVVVTRSPGYLLPLDCHDLDLVRFAQLLAEARAAVAKDPAREWHTPRRSPICSCSSRLRRAASDLGGHQRPRPVRGLLPGSGRARKQMQLPAAEPDGPGRHALVTLVTGDATLASPTSCARCATASQHDASAPPRIRASCGPSTRVSSWTTGSTEVRGAGWGARSARRRSSRRFSAPLPRSWRCRSGGPGVGAIGRVRGYAPLRDRLISHPPSTTPRCPHSSGAVAKSATTAATPPAVEAATVSCLKQCR